MLHLALNYKKQNIYDDSGTLWRLSQDSQSHDQLGRKFFANYLD